jgi:hypothetical protein
MKLLGILIFTSTCGCMYVRKSNEEREMKEGRKVKDERIKGRKEGEGMKEGRRRKVEEGRWRKEGRKEGREKGR